MSAPRCRIATLAIERIRRAVLERADLRGRITLTVVDNSNNLPLADSGSVKRIANANHGGSGGSTRGRLDPVDGGAHSHPLFMDEDASCEPESVARTFALSQA